MASLTYFKAEKGNEVTLVVPKEKISEWAAVEAVMDNAENNSGNLDLGIDNMADDNQKDSAQESMEDEWLPDIEEMKKEASFDEEGDKKIEDDFSV